MPFFIIKNLTFAPPFTYLNDISHYSLRENYTPHYLPDCLRWSLPAGVKKENKPLHWRRHDQYF
ncbi:hypothetical protein SY86_15420 [Erwinia tracheiphila]|uniref:Uncharacterized protein n=1 Tax=Erwinia tracheiphila TaxID=65700 RepID=A0A0M2KHQ1_9GAMM|nr:hypothetical protein AV903_20565 [Erwinia tracheiphila]KKF36511.1 hypothetical protein SY86_15420 [Erwinia tracheiphila]